MRFDVVVSGSNPGRWAVIIPVKRLSVAKTRMTSADVPSLHDLAFAFFQDTATAALHCPPVDRVCVATSDPRVARWALDSGCEVVDDSAAPGINAAAHLSARAMPDTLPVAVVVSDLPCLTPAALARVLNAGLEHSSSVLADLEGTGTTIWMCRPPVPAPRFGAQSRAAHASQGAVDLVALDDDLEWLPARRDIDTPADLEIAVSWGVGPHTVVALGPKPGPDDSRPPTMR